MNPIGFPSCPKLTYFTACCRNLWNFIQVNPVTHCGTPLREGCAHQPVLSAASTEASALWTKVSSEKGFVSQDSQVFKDAFFWKVLKYQYLKLIMVVPSYPPYHLHKIYSNISNNNNYSLH